MNCDIRPLADRVVVQRLKAKEKTDSGLFIPDNAQERAQEALVLAVGPGRRDTNGMIWPPDVLLGAVVLLGKYSGSEIEVDGEKVLVVREDEILGIRAAVASIAGAAI